MSSPPEMPKKLVILPLKNDALVEDRQIVVPGLQDGQTAYNGSSVLRGSCEVVALRVDDRAARTQQLAMMCDAAGSYGQPVLLGGEADAARSDEDPRLIALHDQLYILYNRAVGDSRFMRVARVDVQKNHAGPLRFDLKNDKELRFTQRAGTSVWEKNWSPFIYDDTLHLIYRASPPVVLQIPSEKLCGNADVIVPEPPSLATRSAPWGFGEIRGGTPAVYDAALDRYVTFFHSVIVAAGRQNMACYYVAGMYLFLPEPPFEIDRVTREPLVGRAFYDKTTFANGLKKAVVFPSGIIDDGESWRMMYGKNDATLHVAIWNKAALLKQTAPCS